MGSSNAAQIPPSGDSGVHAQHHQTLVSESENAVSDLQPSSGMPAGSGGGEGGVLISLSQPALGQPASLADASSGFQPLDPLGLIGNRPGDVRRLSTVPSQNVDMFVQVAAELAMPLCGLTQGQSIGAQQNPAIEDMQSVAQIDANFDNVLNRQGTFVPVDPSQQTSTVQYTRTSIGILAVGHGIALYSRKGEERDRQAHFQPVSSLAEEIRLRVGTPEYRNARERRLMPFVRVGEKVDSDGSGQLGIDMLSSPPASRPVGRGPGIRQASSSTATGRYAAAQQPAIPNVSGNAPMPLPANVSNAQQVTGLGGTYVVNATGLGQGIGAPPPGEDS